MAAAGIPYVFSEGRNADAAGTGRLKTAFQTACLSVSALLRAGAVQVGCVSVFPPQGVSPGRRMRFAPYGCRGRLKSQAARMAAPHTLHGPLARKQTRGRLKIRFSDGLLAGLGQYCSVMRPFSSHTVRLTSSSS
ncbi:hypothetical protein [Kingella potus]|nr:hypothetical protein [Kingella potus]UOP00165.1 hypothetical protein LVJ84_09470 [Kingella potus]